MATSKEPQARSQSQHRLSMNSTLSSGMPMRHSSSRQHSHSVSLGSINNSHRVTRRKSINASAVNNAGAARAALNEHDETPSRVSHRRSFNSNSRRPTLREIVDMNKRIGIANGVEDEGENQDSAVADGFADMASNNQVSRTRARRASEGSHLTKGEGKRSSGELRCEKCGKEYKHSSCLTKHLWEHTPEWSLTSKLLISKHQQVQLLEAASVLVGMNQEPGSEAVNMAESDMSSASPAASGSSDLREDDDDYSSAETTPPPMSEQYTVPEGISTGRGKRYSGNSSSFSRSYQSAPSSSLPTTSDWARLSNYGPTPSHRRPSTSGFADAEEAGLVAAVESLCSFGTPKNGPVLLPADVPPVPPLPARFADKRISSTLAGFMEPELRSPTFQAKVSSERDVDMVLEEGDHAWIHTSYGKNEEDDGVFGRMEGIALEAHRQLSEA